jgi:hypothetical protein
MNRLHRPPLQSRLQSSSRAARRDRSLSRRPHLNLSRQQPRHRPRHPRQAKRDHERRAVVAAAEVVVDLVRGR